MTVSADLLQAAAEQVLKTTLQAAQTASNGKPIAVMIVLGLPGGDRMELVVASNTPGEVVKELCQTIIESIDTKSATAH